MAAPKIRKPLPAPAPTTRGAHRTTDRRAATQPEPDPADADDDGADGDDAEEREARVLARAAQLVMESRRNTNGARGIRTDATRGAMRKVDYDQMARDAGMSAANADSRRSAEEDFDAVVRGDSSVFGRDAQQRRDQQRIERNRIAGKVIKKQFTQMRGRRVTNATVSRAMDLESIVSAGPNGIHFGEADIPHLIEEGVGGLASGWAGYMATSQMGGGGLQPMQAAQKAYDAGESDSLVRALGETSLSTGGVLVPDAVAEDYIELLYAATVFLQGGPVRMVLENGVLTLPRVSAGGTFGWVGENANGTSTQQTFDAPRIVLRYLFGLVPHANRLALHSPQAVQQIVMEDMIRGASVLIDLGAIRGAGTAFQPLGVENQVATANRANQAGTTVANITSDYGKMQRFLEEAKIPRIRPYFIFAPRTRWALMTARDGNNNLIWAAEMAMGKFMGVPFGVTTNVPTNLGGGTNESKSYLIEMSQEIYAEGAGPDGMRFDSRDGVAYYDSTLAAVVSAYSQDQTVSRIIQSADIVSRQNGLNLAMLEQQTIA
jgi:HK97 family phage major capsid protein